MKNGSDFFLDEGPCNFDSLVVALDVKNAMVSLAVSFVPIDIHVGARLVGHVADGFATFANDETDGLRGDEERDVALRG